MKKELIKLTYSSSEIAVISLNDPETRNAMSEEMAGQFSSAVGNLHANPAIRVVILRGEGRAFSGGGHLDMLDQKTTIPPLDNRRLMISFYEHFPSITMLEVPVIAAINGHAIGAALGVALACDIRIACESAKVGLNFVKLGLHPGMGTTYSLRRVVGETRAAELLYSGKILTASEAADIGLVNSVVPDDSFEQSVIAAAKEIAEGGPECMRELKRTMRLTDSISLRDALEREAEMQAISYSRAEFREGLNAARDKRKPNFSPVK